MAKCLLLPVHATNKEDKSQAEDHSRKNRTENGGLDNINLVEGEQHHEQDDFDNGSASEQREIVRGDLRDLSEDSCNMG
jgi:hypothetical protein